MKTTFARVTMMALAATVIGCGSNGGAGSMADGSVPGGAGLTWKDNGAATSASFATGARTISATLDYLLVAGGKPSGIGISFGVSTPPPLAPASYACSDTGMNGRIISMSYTMGSASGNGPTSCTIEITTLGDATGTRATGKFSAVLMLDNGTTKTITDGVMDVPLTVSTL